MQQSLITYTNVAFINNQLFVRGIDQQGNRVTMYTDYTPSVCVPYTFNYQHYRNNIIDIDFNTWKRFTDNANMVQLTFDNISNCNSFVRENTKITRDNNQTIINSDVHTAPTNMFVSEYLASKFDNRCSVSSDKWKIYLYDIETTVGKRVSGSDDDIITFTNKRNGETHTMTISQFEEFALNYDDYQIQQKPGDACVSYSRHNLRYHGGFPDHNDPQQAVILITVQDFNTGKVHTWGVKQYDNTDDNVTYHYCDTREQLLNRFLDFLSADYPDAIVGYNNAVFDNTYLAKRIQRVLGDAAMKRLSPCGVIQFKQVEHAEFGKPIVETNWVGIQTLDYLKLYKKFTYGNRESYKLDAVAEDEVGVKKVPNPTKGCFKDFYTGVFDAFEQPQADDDEIYKLGYQRTQLKIQLKNKFDSELYQQFVELNDRIKTMCAQKFVQYNIRDVQLIDMIDNKQKFIDLILTLSYIARCNCENIFSPVQMWDYIIYNTLRERKLVIPIKKAGEKQQKFAGAYVKPPLIGKHEYCVSFDLDSLYPHLIMYANISPETIIRDDQGKPKVYSVGLDQLVNKTYDTSEVHDNDYALAASGVCFSRQHQGVLPYLADKMYSERKAVKKQMLYNKAQHELVVEQLRKRGLM